MAVVTFSRMMGSGGDIIASNVARELGYDLVDSSLISKVAKEAGVSMEDVRGLDEKTKSRMMELMLSIVTPNIDKIMASETFHNGRKKPLAALGGKPTNINNLRGGDET